MKSSKHDPLLREILTGDESSDFRRTSLDHGLKSLRRQRRWRIVRAGTLASLTLLLAWGLLLHRPAKAPVRQIVSSPPRPSAVPAPPTRVAEVKFITDDELLALFPDRPVALIGKPGHQQLVFLDKPVSPARSF